MVYFPFSVAGYDDVYLLQFEVIGFFSAKDAIIAAHTLRGSQTEPIDHENEDAKGRAFKAKIISLLPGKGELACTMPLYSHGQVCLTAYAIVQRWKKSKLAG